jgi:hypothetical protein
MTREDDFERSDLLFSNELSWSKAWEKGSLKGAFRYTLNHRNQDGYISAPILEDAGLSGVHRGLYERYAYSQHRVAPELQADFTLPFANLLTIGATAGLDWVDRQTYITNFVFMDGATTVRGMPASKGERPDYFMLSGLKRWSVGSYVQDVFSPWQWLDVVAGLRFDGFLDKGIVSDTQVEQDELCRASLFGCTPKGYKDIADNGRRYVQWSPRLAVVAKLDRKREQCRRRQGHDGSGLHAAYTALSFQSDAGRLVEPPLWQPFAVTHSRPNSRGFGDHWVAEADPKVQLLLHPDEG